MNSQMTGCCPFCGAEYALTEARCWECKVALQEDSPPTLAVDETAEGGEEVLYELDDWPVASRVELTATLAARGIPSRWEPGLTLAVREADDEAAEKALDELEEGAGDDEEGDEPEGDGGAGDDGGAIAQAAMADLFVAADRLMHEPGDELVAAELGVAADIVGESPAPFGIEAQLWGQVRELSAVVCGHLDGHASPEVVSADARTLREVLRPYV
ncbi:MAG: hypothetical protein ACR2LJ_04995 [Acidimicrobiales bacterium]